MKPVFESHRSDCVRTSAPFLQLVSRDAESLQRSASRAARFALLCLLAVAPGCRDGADAKFDDLRERGFRFTLDEEGHLLGVYLYSDEEHQFEDDDLKPLADLPSPRLLLIESRHVTDAGLMHVKELKGLEELDLTYCRGTSRKDGSLEGGITDAGLAHLKEMTWLKRLGLRYTRVTDEAVDELTEALPDCRIEYNYADPILAAISRRGGDVVGALAELGAEVHLDDEGNPTELKLGTTDLALKHIGRLETITALTLRGNFTGTGLAHLSGLPLLESLDIADPNRGRTIGAEDVRLLAEFPRLRSLDVSGNQLADEELKLLEEMSGLESVKLVGCDVSPARLKSLKQAVPDCEITYSTDPLLNAVLNHQDNVAEAVAATAERIGRNESGEIVAVEFRHSRISDEGLSVLKRLPAVERLSFVYCRRLTDDGMKRLKEFDHLKALTLSHTDVGNRGLIAVGELVELNSLDLTWTRAIDDEGVKQLQGLTELTRLALRGTGVSDVGLLRLSGLSKLASLDLRNTEVTRAGVNRLRQKLPNCNIQRLPE